MTNACDVIFYVAYPYYFPHFLPIGRELTRRGKTVHYVLSDEQNTTLMQSIAEENSLQYTFGTAHLWSIDADFIVFANPFERARELNATTVFLEHGIGTKSTSFFHSITYFDIYLVEGEYKYNRLRELYPQFEAKLKKVGYSKFDDIANVSPEARASLVKKYGLAPDKPTILYAPTFFPSSIEKMSDAFPADFSECNVLIKAHYLSYERSRYKGQRQKLARWGRYANCAVVGVEEYSLVPFMIVADVMISDESSAMFEFAALNKPVISNQYFKLRWSYYLMPWKLRQRIDTHKDAYRSVLGTAHSYTETLALTKDALAHPENQPDKSTFIRDVVGVVDGQVSARIADVLETYNSESSLCH